MTQQEIFQNMTKGEWTIMNQQERNFLLTKLDSHRIRISFNKRPIKMELFLSFLKVPVKRSNDHLGSSNGWTKLYNKELNLIIGGGIVNSVEYLNDLQYGVKLDNPYSNYVNPFYLFDILNAEGQKFFLEYYKESIDEVVADLVSDVKQTEDSLERKRKLLYETLTQIEELNISAQQNPSTSKLQSESI